MEAFYYIILQKSSVLQYLILKQILSLVAVHGGHDGAPDHGHGLVLGQSILLHSLFKLHDDFLDGLLITDGGFKTSLNILLGSCILHSSKVGDDFLLVRGDEDVLHVLRGSLVGREELVQHVVQAGLLEEVQHRAGALLVLDGPQYLQHEVQGDALLDLVLVDDDLESIGRQQTGAHPQSGYLSQSSPVDLNRTMCLNTSLDAKNNCNKPQKIL